jgi:RecB family exonuclease
MTAPSVGTGRHTAQVQATTANDQILTGDRLVVAPFGPEADDALARAIVAAKGGDPLAPVTVAVPSTLCGLSLRRQFATRPLGAPAAGLANVRFLVLARVAELLGAPRLAAAGRQPLNHAVRLHAVRVTLLADAGRLAPVVEHPDTLAAVDATMRDLRKATVAARSDLASMGPTPAHAVRLYDALRDATTGDWYDDDDLAEAAAAAVRDDDPALADVGAAVVHLPRRLSRSQLELLAALADRNQLWAVIGTTGDHIADDAAQVITTALQPSLGAPTGVSLATATGIATRPHATVAVRAGDPDDEVRAAVRGVVERLERDVPLHRMAIVWRSADPYALLVQELAAADIPYSGPGSRTLAQTLTGRTLLGALSLPAADFERESVFSWLTSAPVLLKPGSRVLVPTTRFETLAIDAVVVTGLGHWDANLAALSSRLRARLAELDADPEDEGALARSQRVTRDIEMAEQLRTFVADLGGQLTPPAQITWHAFATWARHLLARYLGEPGGDWPQSEFDAYEAIMIRIDALAALDDVGAASLPAFLHALEQELSVTAQRAGRFGDGVFVGRVGDATGMNFATVFVLGLADGAFPPAPTDDPLVPDRLRSRVRPGTGIGSDIPKRSERRADERRDWLAALAAADERIISTPQADPRAQRARIPARWFLEEVSHLAGQPVGADDLDHLGPTAAHWFRAIPSFESGLRAALVPASLPERDLASLLVAHSAPGARGVERHPLITQDDHLVQGFAAQSARRARHITRWSGLVDIDLRDVRGAWSSSRIQTLARCPFQFFLSSVLEIAEPTKPEAVDVINPADRGHVVHQCLERFVRERLADPPAPDEPWSEADHERLRAIAAEEFAAAQRNGLTGRPLLWRLEQNRILTDLARTLREDDRRRREERLVPYGVEVGFGDTDSPVEFALSDGTPVRFTGRIDRVDRAERTDAADRDAPDQLVVVDYKTGKSDDYKPLLKDPVNRGSQIQLPVYALGARARYAAATVRAAFWFVTKRGQFATIGYDVDDGPLRRLRSVLDVLVGMIAKGQFPARPGDAKYESDYAHCNWCPYTEICPPDRARRWEQVRHDAGLASYVSLAEQPTAEQPTGDA